ncbi:MAG: DNA-binding response regulator [Sphingobacteriales bacterium 50-39]|nr:response regulator transcription factor [Sphingobacteriales bacterium]OJW54335.1 MAG: DNA-binding response regulator [Sphingobacteriales bacterium 50-39]
MQALIIEEEKRIAELITHGLEAEGFAVTVTYDGTSGRTLATSISYDIVLIDALLPGSDGLEICKAIRRVRADLPIIMLSAWGETDHKIGGFDAGADDYLVKPFELRELVARIKAVVNRRKRETAPLSENIIYGDLELNLNGKSVKREGREIWLTPREFQLLEYMVLNRERLLSRMELAEKVWNVPLVNTNFIDVYINYLRKKIDHAFPTKLIHTRKGEGFIFTVSPPAV